MHFWYEPKVKNRKLETKTIYGIYSFINRIFKTDYIQPQSMPKPVEKNSKSTKTETEVVIFHRWKASNQNPNGYSHSKITQTPGNGYSEENVQIKKKKKKKDVISLESLKYNISIRIICPLFFFL